MPLAYLFSRYPVVSQTFCDSEMLALEAPGRELVIGSLNPPPNSFRHERLRAPAGRGGLPAAAHGAEGESLLPDAMAALAAEHDARYGARFKAGTRARNAAWFAPVLARRGVRHIHVHFANRATHTALFLKQAGFTFSFTAHAQDYMVDLGQRRPAARTRPRGGVRDCGQRFQPRRPATAYARPARAKSTGCTTACSPDDFPPATPGPPGPLRLVSIGRLIEFKGFHHLIEAVGLLRDRGVDATLDIIGDGPWRDQLTALD